MVWRRTIVDKIYKFSGSRFYNFKRRCLEQDKLEYIRGREVLHELKYLLGQESGAISAKLEKSNQFRGTILRLTLQISSNFAILRLRKLIFKTILLLYDSSDFPDFTILQLQCAIVRFYPNGCSNKSPIVRFSKFSMSALVSLYDLQNEEVEGYYDLKNEEYYIGSFFFLYNRNRKTRETEKNKL